MRFNCIIYLSIPLEFQPNIKNWIFPALHSIPKCPYTQRYNTGSSKYLTTSLRLSFFYATHPKSVWSELCCAIFNIMFCKLLFALWFDLWACLYFWYVLFSFLFIPYYHNSFKHRLFIHVSYKVWGGKMLPR